MNIQEIRSRLQAVLNEETNDSIAISRIIDVLEGAGLVEPTELALPLWRGAST